MESYDWLFGESSEILEDSPKAGQSFEIPTEPVWTTAKGDKIPLSKMETRHICNCIRLLESKNKYKWYQIFQNELKRRRLSELKTSFSL